MSTFGPTLAAAPLGTLAKLKGLKTRKVHHGSPHDFDKFSMSKIGTGEGAQAYGHGLYFSGSEDIAKFYRDALSGQSVSLDGKSIDDAIAELPSSVDSLARTRGITIEAAAKAWDAENVNETRKALENVSIYGVDGAKRQAPSNAATIDDLIATGRLKVDEGKLYTAEIPDESNMLDWDKPLSEQPEGVRNAVADAMARSSGMPADHPNFADTSNMIADQLKTSDMSGAEGYKQIARVNLQDAGEGTDHAAYASARLNEKGIPGITYKGATSDERNFVVFDDELINLVEKGLIDPKLLAPLAGAGAVAAQLNEDVPDTVYNEMEMQAAALDFAQRRHAKKDIWSAYKETVNSALSGFSNAGEAGAAILGAVGGGLAGAIVQIGGNTSPLFSPEEAAQGRDFVQSKTSFEPSPGAQELIKPVINAMDSYQTNVIDPTLRRYNQEAPWIKEGWDNLPDRFKGILEPVSELYPFIGL